MPRSLWPFQATHGVSTLRGVALSLPLGRIFALRMVPGPQGLGGRRAD